LTEEAVDHPVWRTVLEEAIDMSLGKCDENSVVIGTEIDDSGISSWQSKGISVFFKVLEPIMLPIQKVRVPFRRKKHELTT